MLVVGFFWSTVALYHGTFFINSLAHVDGSQRYLTGDDSRNNFWLALITLGEGWHNNHHHYQSSTRQGFRWWEVDISYYTLKAHVVDRPGVGPARAPRRRSSAVSSPVGRKVLEKVAGELAAAFRVERLSRTPSEKRGPESTCSRTCTGTARRARDQVEERLAELSLSAPADDPGTA